MSLAKGKSGDDLISEKYKKITQIEHVLLRPGMYIGSVTEDIYDTWVFDIENKCMIKKNTKFVPGLYKIFDEIAVNSLDQIERLKLEKTDKTNFVKDINISIDRTDNSISITNSGDGLDIVKHPEHDIYIPELVFGNLLTSTNYDENIERTIGGMNGLGSKTVNIFSKKFIVETVDAVRQLHYYQEFSNNMQDKTVPIIKKYKKYPFTKITFMPDYEKFSLTGLEDDIVSLFYKRAYDISGLTDASIKVSLNDEKLPINNFEKYADLYLEGKKKIYEEVNKRWKIIISYSEKGFEQVSFVNGISTMKGGKHVDHVVTQLTKQLIESLQKKYKDVVFKPQHIKDNLFIFINATIGNPSFDSQTKDCLTTPYSKFGSKCELSKAFITKLMSTELVERIYESATASGSKLLKKTDGRKQSNIKGIPKLDDANWAGTTKSKECTLILTEGDSAKSMAIAGLSVVGRDKYGVFPLRGKIMNTLDTNEQKIADNTEITALKKILALESKKKYKNLNDLRYGSIMIMTDQDSVTFDTPCMVKEISTGLIDIKPICELNDDSWCINQFNTKEYSECENYLIWSDKGWTKIKKVMKHKVTKPIYRVLTHTGCVDVTEDHSLVTKSGEEITVKECIIEETELLHKKYVPDIESIEINIINEEHAYALGYFQADGWCTIDSKITLKYKDNTYEANSSVWQINCVEIEPLEKLKIIFEKYESNDEIIEQNIKTKYQCDKCNKYFKKKDNLKCHQNIKSDCSIVKKIEFEIIKKKFSKDAYSNREFIYVLQAKVVRKGIAQKYRKMFYNSLREKKIPIEILNASVSVQQSFIDGFYAGDGNKGIRTTDHFSGEHKSQIMGLFQILQNCGYTPSINCSSEKLNVYNILMANERGYNRPEYTIKKIIDVSEKYEDSYVYDFETDNHHFHGSIGNLVVHNCDGSHIKALLFNMFNSMWPSLMAQDGFLTSMLTPIIKAKNKKQCIEFYNMGDYENWKETVNQKGWEIKYYKGLGTSTSNEAKDYFRDMKKVTYIWEDKKSAESLDMAFNKKRADDRKEWLYNYNKNNTLDYKDPKVNYTDFIDKDLIHFSNYNLERSIPSLCDGFKISTRKIIYSCFKRNLTKEIRVSQLAGYVSETANYHHGETSLQEAIIGLAQNFVGSNNINLLMPNGQYGDRIMGGSNSASPRYLNTELNSLTLIIYNKADNNVINYLDDDGYKIEPEFYMPIIPMLLVNGSTGIGTGFSTNIPCHNPQSIVNVLKKMLKAKTSDIETDDIIPWYQGFKGKIVKDKGKLMSVGNYSRLTSSRMEITELPIGVWTQDYKEFLEKMIEKDDKILRDYESHYTESTVHFILDFYPGVVNNLLEPDISCGLTKFEKMFKLSSSKNFSTSNMHIYNEKGTIIKCATALEIIKLFYNVRIVYYQKRKDFLIDQLENELIYLDARIKFILDIIEDRLQVSNQKKSVIEEYLKKNSYPLMDNKYEYLIKMPIYNLTYEKKEEFMNEIKNKKEMLETIKSTSIEQMWLSDLTDFEKGYKTFVNSVKA
jgi:DNA gyrase/topoisomerase IV subunit B